MTVNILKNCSSSNRYSSRYIIKFVSFTPFIMLLDIVSFCMIFNYLYIGLLIYYKFKSIILFFLRVKILNRNKIYQYNKTESGWTE